MRIPAVTIAATLAASAVASAAPTSKPHPAPTRINVEKLQPKSLLPKRKLHVELVVETNRLGQVTRVRSGKSSPDDVFNLHMYGNALQAFIRTADGKAIPGTYRLTYDYDPKTTRVHRDVELLHAGGVDPNAKGAATDMMDIAKRNQNRTPPPSIWVTPVPNPAPSVNVKRMPDLPQVMNTPSPSH